MSNLRLKDHTWDAANVYDSSLGKTQEQINAEVGTSLAGKQGALVSGETIKTVNGASILGSGNIEIQGGGTGEDGYSPVVTIANITGGHRVNITDKTHPQGQNFDVMNGTNGAKGDTGDPAPASAVVPAVELWLADNITQETGYVIDDSLTVTGAAADAKKTGDMFSIAITEKDTLPANTDLNTFTAIGLYRIPSGNSVIPTLVNYPSSNPGRLLVLSDENGYFCTQIVITNGNVVYTRVQTNASQHTWSEWASYDSTTVRLRSCIKNENDQYDANLTLANGVYSFNNTSVASASANLPSPYGGILLVFAGSSIKFQIYANRYGTIYYRTKYQDEPFSEWIRPLKADTTLSISGAAADAKAVGDAIRSKYVHDGDILRMSTTPEAIPVNENHMGYNEFISSTWNTLLPTGYQEGDAYNASTTKIHGVKVERASSWTSTPYGTNTDTYTIYRYIFTPQNGYDKTLFLTSGCHGNEAEAYWSLYRLVRMIYFEGHKYPTLRNLRDYRLIIIPSWNPWGFQHYRRYNAFSALNTGSTDVAKNYQAWEWLKAANHQVTVNGTVYDISQVGEANVIWETLNEYQDSINLWLDFHTDPYAGRDTSNVDIDDPRGVTPPYGCYGFSATDSRGYRQLFSVMYDFYNILEDEYQFTETWHPQATNPGGSSLTGWMSQFGFTSGVVEISTFMDGFPYASGSAGMMKLAQEYYGNCITEMLR